MAYAVSITVVAAVAAWNSYWHMVAVALRGHQDPFLAYSLPFSVDGMLLVSALAIAEDKANRRRPRGWARFAFWLGANVSIAANVASVVVHHGLDALSIAVSAWPPVALLVVVEIMAKPGRPETAAAGVVNGLVVEPTTTGLKCKPEVDSAAATDVDSDAVQAGDVVAVAALIGPALHAAADLAAQGHAVSRDALTERLRDAGYAVSNARASTLVRLVRAGESVNGDHIGTKGQAVPRDAVIERRPEASTASA